MFKCSFQLAEIWEYSLNLGLLVFFVFECFMFCNIHQSWDVRQAAPQHLSNTHGRHSISNCRALQKLHVQSFMMQNTGVYCKWSSKWKLLTLLPWTDLVYIRARLLIFNVWYYSSMFIPNLRAQYQNRGYLACVSQTLFLNTRLHLPEPSPTS